MKKKIKSGIISAPLRSLKGDCLRFKQEFKFYIYLQEHIAFIFIYKKIKIYTLTLIYTHTHKYKEIKIIGKSLINLLFTHINKFYTTNSSYKILFTSINEINQMKLKNNHQTENKQHDKILYEVRFTINVTITFGNLTNTNHRQLL